MILAWEACSLSLIDGDAPSTNTGCSQICVEESNFEPSRTAKTLEPPKRFVRAVSRRMLSTGQQSL
jgi:hypothetical protein